MNKDNLVSCDDLAGWSKTILEFITKPISNRCILWNLDIRKNTLRRSKIWSDTYVYEIQTEQIYQFKRSYWIYIQNNDQIDSPVISRGIKR